MTKELIELEEYVPYELPSGAFSPELARTLLARYPGQVSIEPPSFLTGNRWRLTSQGCVGYLPLSDDVALSLKPKVGLSNLFRMLELAYRMHIEFPKGIFSVESLDDLYARLAHVLALRVLDRSRKGFYRAYVACEENLPYLRGRIHVDSMVRAPWRTSLDCTYEEHTVDVDENRILAWTLEVILRSGLCSRQEWSRKEVLPYVRRAYREVCAVSTPAPYSARECTNRVYHRLNEDYRLPHGLCRFFLEHTGPGYRIGDHIMAPFLIDMNRLFEAYVAAWLKINLPSAWSIREQEIVSISAEHGLRYRIDLALVENATGQIRCVLDTKYKKPDLPSEADISQVVAYAESTGCNQAVLIYPSSLTRPVHLRVGTKQVHSLVFDLRNELDEAGRIFMDQMFAETGLNGEVQEPKE